MLPETISASHRERWQQVLADGYTRVADLLHALDLDAQRASLPASVLETFPMRVPRGFVARMRRGDPRDPLLRQVLPVADEAIPVPGFVDDPVGDLASLRAQGLLQKYRGRALVIATGACAVHCRYCFRRAFPYQAQQGAGDVIDTITRQLRDDTDIEEIILSGGDPLTLSNRKLTGWLARFEDIGSLRRIRIHTRVPVVLPERVDAGLLDSLRALNKKLVIVLHVNHAQEIDASLQTAIAALADTRATLLNQSVLLKDVNDSVSALTDLSEALFTAGVLPYYLHQLDPVAGAAHFAVPDEVALELHADIRARLPGYLVPQLVREVAGAEAKIPLSSIHNATPSHNQNLVT